jgi:hypothetical protein
MSSTNNKPDQIIINEKNNRGAQGVFNDPVIFHNGEIPSWLKKIITILTIVISLVAIISLVIIFNQFNIASGRKIITTPVINTFHIKGSNSAFTIKPSNTITITVKDIIEVKAEVYPEEDTLVFFWYTCSQGDELQKKSMGNSEFLYVASDINDCIHVTMKKNDEILDDKFIFVNIQPRTSLFYHYLKSPEKPT